MVFRWVFQWVLGCFGRFVSWVGWDRRGLANVISLGGWLLVAAAWMLGAFEFLCC